MKLSSKIILAIIIALAALIIVPNAIPGGTVQAANVKTYKIKQFPKEKFYKVKDVAKRTIDCEKINTSKTIKYDLDKNGKKDKIIIKYNDDDYSYSIYVNGKNLELSIGGQKYKRLYSIPTIYLVDLNKKDKFIDIVVDNVAEGSQYTTRNI